MPRVIFVLAGLGLVAGAMAMEGHILGFINAPSLLIVIGGGALFSMGQHGARAVFHATHEHERLLAALEGVAQGVGRGVELGMRQPASEALAVRTHQALERVRVDASASAGVVRLLAPIEGAVLFLGVALLPAGRRRHDEHLRPGSEEHVSVGLICKGRHTRQAWSSPTVTPLLVRVAG